MNYELRITIFFHVIVILMDFGRAIYIIWYSGPRCTETGREWRKVNALTFLHFFFFEINAGLITFADVFVYEQFGDMINILHEMCV